MSQAELAEYRATKLKEQLEINKEQARRILQGLISHLTSSTVESVEITKIVVVS